MRKKGVDIVQKMSVTAQTKKKPPCFNIRELAYGGDAPAGGTKRRAIGY